MTDLFTQRKNEAIGFLDIQCNSLVQPRYEIGFVSLTNDNKFLITVNRGKRYSVTVWDFEEKKPLRQFPICGTDNAAHVSVTGKDNSINCVTGDFIYVYDLSGNTLHEVSLYESLFNKTQASTVTKDGDLFILGFRDGSIRFWDRQERDFTSRIDKANEVGFSALAVSKDNKYFVSASRNKCIAVWELSSKKLFHQFDKPHAEESGISVAITKDNRYIVSTSCDKTIAIWSILEKKLVHRFGEAHSGWITSIVLTYDDKFIVSVSEDCTIKVWDLGQKTLVHAFTEAHSGLITSVTLTNDNKFIVTGSLDSTVGVWDIGEKKLAYRIGGAPPEKTKFLSTTEDGELLLSIANDDELVEWNVPQEKQNLKLKLISEQLKSPITSSAITEVNGTQYYAIGYKNGWIGVLGPGVPAYTQFFTEPHKDEVISIYFINREGSPLQMVSESNDGIIGVWDIPEKKCLRQFKGSSPSKLFFESYLLIQATPGEYQIWNAFDGRTTHKFPGRYWSITPTEVPLKAAFNVYLNKWEDYRCFLVAFNEKNVIEVWDQFIVWGAIQNPEYQLQSELKPNRAVFPTVATMTKDQKHIVAYHFDIIEIWDLATQKLHKKIVRSGRANKIDSLIFTDDHQSMVIQRNDSDNDTSVLEVWDIGLGESLHVFQTFSQLNALVVTPNSIIASSEDGGIRVWNISKNFLQPARLEGFKERSVKALTITKDNKYIVLGTEDLKLTVWDIETRKLVSQIDDTHSDEIRVLAVTSDSKFIISGSRDGSIAVWDWRQKTLTHRFEEAHGNNSGIIALTVTTDDRYIVSGGWDSTIKVWDLVEKKLFHVFEEQVQTIDSVAAIDEKRFLSISERIIRAWDIGTKGITNTFYRPLDWHDPNARYCSDPPRDKVSATPDRKFAVISNGKSIDVFRLDNKNDYTYHSFAIGSHDTVFTADSKYIFSVNYTKGLIQMLDLETKQQVHEIRIKSSMESRGPMLLTSDSKYLILGPTVVKLPFVFGSSEKVNNFPFLRYGLDKLASSETETQVRKGYFAMVSDLHTFPHGWNFLNYLFFYLPGSAQKEYIDSAIESKVFLSLDQYQCTQLDYAIDYNGPQNSQTDQFFYYFFKNFPKFLNLNSTYRKEVVCGISRSCLKVYQRRGEIPFFNVFNTLFRNEVDCLVNFKDLPLSGQLKDDVDKAFVYLQDLKVPIGSWRKTITIERDQPQVALDYKLLLFYCTYEISDPTMFELLVILNEIESKNVASDASKMVIDLLWKKTKKRMWLKFAFYVLLIGLFTSFAVTRSIDEGFASGSLIATDLCMTVMLGLECLQVLSNPQGYFLELWNYLDMLLICLTALISVLFWTDSFDTGLSFFVSLALFLFYSKLLLVLRVVDQLRNLIRMIIEVIKDMTSFVVVIVTYMVAFSLIFFQNRRAIDDDTVDNGYFPDDLMEMFYLAFTGGDNTEYSGTMLPFYILIVVLQCLILLNLIISIMGNTFGRVTDNFEAVELRERINMLLEFSEEVIMINKLKKKVLCCSKRAGEEEGKAPENKFLLTVEEFGINDEATLSVEDIGKKISDIRDEISSLQSTLSKAIVQEMAEKMKAMQEELFEKIQKEIKPTPTPTGNVEEVKAEPEQKDPIQDLAQDLAQDPMIQLPYWELLDREHISTYDETAEYGFAYQQPTDDLNQQPAGPDGQDNNEG